MKFYLNHMIIALVVVYNFTAHNLATNYLTSYNDIQALSNKEKAVNFIESFNYPDRIDFSIISDSSFVQHDLNLKDGKTAYLHSILEKSETGIQVDVIRALQDKDHVFVQSKQALKNVEIVYDVFRFEKGKIVEHWINKEEAKPLNPSGRSQIDGHLQIEDLDKTERNKVLVKEFLTTLIINQDLDQADNFFHGNHYIQHNADVADGLHSIKTVLQEFKNKDIPVGFNKIMKVIGEGNFVLTMNEGFFNEQPVAYFDLLRVENDKIVEHWDVIENIPPRSKWKNDNGKF